MDNDEYADAIRTVPAREAVKALDALNPGDSDGGHKEADEILLEAAPAEVRAAYLRARKRAGGWGYA